MPDLQHYTIPAEGVALTTLTLRDEHGLIFLRRRLRAIGAELNFQPRHIARLSTAAYEAGRRVLAARATGAAEVSLIAEGTFPALRVTLRIEVGDDDERRAVMRALEEARLALAPLTDRADVDRTPSNISIAFVVISDGAAAGRGRVSVERSTDPQDAPDDPEQLRAALHELQIELQETNRGVVALYADLDTQAEQLRQAEDRLRTLLDSVHDYAICMLRADGLVASWNSGAERLFGYAADEILERSYSCFFMPSEQQEGLPDEHLRVARRDGRCEAEHRFVRRGGSVFEADVLVTSIAQAGGRQEGFSLVVRDITERKRLEGDLRRRAHELEAANRAKEEFLATLSHELRTPLNAMVGWTRLLRMGKLNESAVARALDTIERNAHLQEQLIGDILDLSRIVTGKLRIELRPIDLVPVVEAAVDAVRPTADAKRVELHTAIEACGTVMGDPNRLQQVVWNLLSNAIKFTPPEGTVVISSSRAGATAVITVADTGDGIAPDLLPYVFDRFRQGDVSATRVHGGLGLGLSIVRHIVELHGGQVQASSEGVDRGATFVVRLPVRAVQRIDIPRSPPETALAGLKVLVVDDDADARDVVSTALAQYGAATAVAGSARDAIQSITDFHPDVVVSDIKMPHEDGYTLVRRIRALAPQVADVPVVALTAFARPEERRRALIAGFRHFVAKPVEVEELAAVVRSLAERRAPL